MAQHREPSSIAHAAADEVRALNLATASPEGFYDTSGDQDGGPSEVSATVQGLLALAEHLPRALEQASRALQHLEEHQVILTTDGSDVGDQVSRALRGLIDAQQAFRMAGVHLREAGVPLARMSGFSIEDESELVEHRATGTL